MIVFLIRASATATSASATFSSAAASSSLRRFLRAAVYTLILAASLKYGAMNHPRVTLELALANPQRYDKVLVDTVVEGRVFSVEQNGIILRAGEHLIPVRGRIESANPGDFIFIRALFHEQGWLELKAARVAKGRRSKIVLSALAAAAVLCLFVRHYRFDFRRLLFLEDRRA